MIDFFGVLCSVSDGYERYDLEVRSFSSRIVVYHVVRNLHCVFLVFCIG